MGQRKHSAQGKGQLRIIIQKKFGIKVVSNEAENTKVGRAEEKKQKCEKKSGDNQKQYGASTNEKAHVEKPSIISVECHLQASILLSSYEPYFIKGLQMYPQARKINTSAG